jgi:autotransporter-associated beta strand protein
VGTGPIVFINNAARLSASAPGLVIPNHIDLSLVLTNTFGPTNDFDFTLSGDVDLGNSGSDPQIKVSDAPNTITFTGHLINSLGLVKGGAGTVVLTGANTYGGNTEVLQGALVVNNTTGSGTSAGTVTVDPSGTLGGNGSVAGPVNLNGVLSPGNSVGKLTTGDQTWMAGGQYLWQMNDAAGTAGNSPGWDKLDINGALNLWAIAGNKFTINLASLAGAIAGNAANFNNTAPHSWTLVTTTGGINGFDPAAFDLNTARFSNSLGAAYFTLTTSPDGKDLLLNLQVGTLGTGTGLYGNYYNTPGAGSSPTSMPDPPALSRLDPTVNFIWGTGSPDPLINADHFAVRWTGFVQPSYSQTYTFIANTDDGVRLWVDGQQVINNWLDKGPSDTLSTPVALVAGQKYGLVMEYYENAVGATAQLKWSTANRGPEIIPQSQLYPASSPAQPAFALSPDRTSMTLTWSGTYTLESTTSLTPPISWTPISSSSGTVISIDPGTPQMFFHLVSQ